MYLLDTSVWIAYLRQAEAAKKKSFQRYVIQPLENLQVSVCGIVLYELFQGAKNKKHVSDVVSIRAATECFELNEEDYRFGGELSQKLMAKNQFLPMPDVMIAVCALKNNLTLVSADRHFERVKKIERGLKYERFG